MLTIQGATVRIDGFTILRDLSLEVPTGTVVGLIGRNGAGKTTTLRSIMGLVAMESGRVELDGQDMKRLAPHQRAACGIGYMPEDRRLIPSLSVEDNIRMPTWAQAIDGAEDRLATIYELMPDLKSLARRPATQLSGGQQKLVSLARCFMRGNKLLLLDEPFEGVAPALAQRLLRAVQQLAEADRSLSVLLCESEVKWPRLLASRIYVIERGEAFEEKPAVSSSSPVE